MPRRSIEHSTTGVANVIDMKTGERAEVPAIPVICANVRHYRLQLGLEQIQTCQQSQESRPTVKHDEKHVL